jgi:anti-sigma B factor antagonist
MGFSVSTALVDGTTVVAASGELDLATAPALGDAITAAVQDPSRRPVVVDLAEVRFCDSSGIRVLVHGRRLADEHDLPYRVIGASGVVLDVLELTGVWALLSAPTIADQ